MSTNSKPSYLGHRQRLRAKFSACGLDPFLDHEILELLLTYCIARRDTKPTAWALIRRFGSLGSVLDAPLEELCAVKGVGEQSARFLKLIRAVFKKYSLEEVKERVTVRTPEQVLNYCKASLSANSDECLELIYLSVRNTIIGTEVVARGGLDRVSVSPRTIVERALAAKAAALILVHNHPSGDPTPSMEDIVLTKEVTRAAALLGIAVHDHIIIGKGAHYSLKANGKI